MPRWKLTIEYDGRPFCGWQLQQAAQEAVRPSVQGALEQAIARFSGETPRTTVAGRTDAGVHALGQVAHVDLQRATSPHEIQGALNFHLQPHPVSILRVEAAEETFDARHSAQARHYVYKLECRRGPLTFNRGLVWQLPYALDTAAMQEAATLLRGRHDFSTFRAAECQSSGPVRTLDYFDFNESATDHGVQITARIGARSFLHHQVRNMMGTLALIGRGQWTLAQFTAAFAAADRRAGGPTAPADGLYLAKVDY